MTVLVLAGPPAVGHNTVADAFCARHPGAVLIDGDDVRRRGSHQYVAPWDGAEGDRQYQQGIRDCCALARARDAAGRDVLLVDVAPPETLALYRAHLHGVSGLRIVLLLADLDVLLARDIARDPDPRPDRAAWHERIRVLHRQLAGSAVLYDHVIDTGVMSAERAAERLAALILR